MTVMRFVRWWLPAIVVAGGLATLIFNPTVDGLEGASHIVGAGLAILLLNLLFRFGISGDKERDEEDAARDFFTRHGYWPGEAPEHPPNPTRDPPVRR